MIEERIKILEEFMKKMKGQKIMNRVEVEGNSIGHYLVEFECINTVK